MTTPIAGYSVIPAANFRRLLALNGGPGATAKGQIIEIYYSKEVQWGIRADVLVAQMLHETGYLTSWWCGPTRNNMAGIGVTGESQHANPNLTGWVFKSEDGTWRKGYTFVDPWAGIEAHYAHMSGYLWPNEGPRNHADLKDPRYAAVKAAFTQHKWSPCRVLTDLNGRWAVPGTTYGQMVEGVMRAAEGS